MRKPTIHLNGSDAHALIVGYMTAANAVYAAIGALQATHPHGRDYYTQVYGPDSQNPTYEAIDEYRERLAKLQAVLDDLMELWEHCQLEMDKRAKR